MVNSIRHLVASALVLPFLRAFAQHGADATKDMGPVAFMWPPDREWGAAQDNTPPCGSVQGVVNRTRFPLVNGQVALVAQDESWSVQVAISRRNNPTQNSDFEIVIPSMTIPEIDEGHMCYPIPNPPISVQAGANATLQIIYTSDMEHNQNETYYACADITYVPVGQFTFQVPCFNATQKEFGNVTSPSKTSTGIPAATSSSTTAPNSGSVSQSKSGLSGGAIAGIVIGVIIGVAALIAGVFLYWRRGQQLSRLRAQEVSVRNVKWTDQSESGSASSVGRDNIPLGSIRS